VQADVRRGEEPRHRLVGDRTDEAHGPAQAALGDLGLDLRPAGAAPGDQQPRAQRVEPGQVVQQPARELRRVEP
jgi:hypothetical protein